MWEVLAITLAVIAIGLGAGWLSYRMRIRDLLGGMEQYVREEAAARTRKEANQKEQ